FSKYPIFAERISQGVDLGERILDLSPLYLYLNLLFQKVYGRSWEGLALLQVFLGSLNVLLIYLIGEKVFNRTVGFMGALLLILYGNMTLFELTLEPEALLIFLNSLGVLSLLIAQERILSGSSPWGFFLPGILLGLSVITKPNGLLFLPPAILWIGRTQVDGFIRMKASLFLLLGVFLVVSPITLRNYLNFHDFVLITADGGKVFYHGNGPGSTGMERADLPDQGFREEGMGDPDPAHALFRQAARSISGKPLKPSECSGFWFRRTLDFMSSRPLTAFSLVGKKFFYFWGNYEVHEIDSNYKYDLILRRWPLVPFGVLSILGMVGMVLARKGFRQAFLLYSMVGVYLLSVLIFFAASRYRLPAAPFLALFGAFALTSFYTLWKEKRRIALSALLSISLLLWPLINLPFRSEVKALERWQMATRIHYSLGGNFLFQKRQYREAIEEYRKALALAPDFAPAYNRLGMCHAILNELDEAEEDFQKVIELAPNMDQGYLNLGMVYLLKGKPGIAIPLLEKALSLNPENTRAREQLQNLRSRSPG
ncbi:MAG TPA: tetratricopeptide repeat protein, partial [Thermodesulfobacteriota bacterium]|nr:tetratricopeptide repeat protein [Thermodesulfobacteriota bacterium]